MVDLSIMSAILDIHSYFDGFSYYSWMLFVTFMSAQLINLLIWLLSLLFIEAVVLLLWNLSNDSSTSIDLLNFTGLTEPMVFLVENYRTELIFYSFDGLSGVWKRLLVDKDEFNESDV